MSEAATDSQNAGKGGANAGYRVLARKYRPKDFSDLIGQAPMVRTLRNAFDAGRIAQAWMLTGVRGVGKTTTARILARALNYRTPTIDRPTVEFTDLGEHCQAIMEGRHVDVMEMDAASHTGIDDIREIIDQVRYAPVSARYKVYIIDEVHMLSTQAFNGLLKTLEEPPPHVKFIFATTEIRKVPVTVLSRCQRFDLRRVEAAELIGHLGKIAGLEAVEVEAEALSMVARAAEGSVRDSLSILDQAIAHSGAGRVEAAAVRDMLGLADRARIIDLFEKLMAGDVAGVLAEYRAQYDGGADPAVVLTELADFNHLVTRLRFVPQAAEDTALTGEERSRGSALAGSLSIRVLSRSWQMLLKAIQEVQTSPRPAAAAEMALIRLAHAADLPTLDEAIRATGEGGGSMQTPPRPAQAETSSEGPRGGAPAPRPQMAVGGGGGAQRLAAEPRPAVPQPFTPAPQAVAAPVEVTSLGDIVALAEQHRDIKLKVSIRQYLRLVKLEPGHIVVALASDAPKTLMTELATRLKAWTGRTWLVSVANDGAAAQPTLAETAAANREAAMVDARSDPTVAAVLARFPGAKVLDVSLPKVESDAAGLADAARSGPAPDATGTAGADLDDEDDMD